MRGYRIIFKTSDWWLSFLLADRGKKEDSGSEF